MANKVCSECQFENPSTAEFCRQCRFPFNGEWPSLVNKLAGNYKLVRRVGGGGFGAVYEARHITLGNAFAVKVLDPKLAQSEHFVERFQQEAHVMAELRHENVLQVLDFGFSEEIGPYLVTEWLEGKSLFKIWRYAGEPLNRGWILAIYSQLLDALQLAHERGVVHRDLKPENIMLTTGSRDRILIKIVDFGIAQMVGHHFEKNKDKNKERDEDDDVMIVGTPYYMAPEQILGEQDKIGPRSDLYACGIMLGELLTGRRIFDGNSYEEIMKLHVEAYPPSLKELSGDDDFPDVLEEVFQRALAKEPDDRFQNAEEFYNALQAAMKQLAIEPVWEYIYQDLDTSKRPPSLSSKGKIHYKKIHQEDHSSRTLLLFGAIGLLISLISISMIWWLFGTPPKPPKPRPRKRNVQAKWLTSTTTNVPDAGPLHDKKVVPLPPTERHWPDSPPREEKNNADTPQKPDKTKNIYLHLLLKSKPTAARVWINGKYRGKTPLRFKGALGSKLRILIRKKGYIKQRIIWKVKKYRRTRKITLIEKLL